ncbi:hypothetical protein [Absidia glauca]|uniref:Uncharacterized protein n=1 Tax=Absidia glauca TaxID=4829 RepID=A0A168NB10_ABSGL|nr:hypothetical protein [Absidia glauca]
MVNHQGTLVMETLSCNSTTSPPSQVKPYPLHYIIIVNFYEKGVYAAYMDISKSSAIYSPQPTSHWHPDPGVRRTLRVLHRVNYLEGLLTKRPIGCKQKIEILLPHL